jgi:hypothetical protein
VRKVYCDSDISAWSGKIRPEYEAMLADIPARVARRADGSYLDVDSIVID